jgi:hypothetical protein
MTCADIQKAMADFLACEQTPEGARIATHCLYPSFESVRVFVAKIGDGFTVHDGAGAHNVAWLQGRDADLIEKSLTEAAQRFHLIVAGKALVARVNTVEWLTGAILAVANASAFAARDAVDKIVAAQEEALVDRIGSSLTEVFSQKHIAKNVNIKGASGGTRHFDFVVERETPQPVYINSVTPRRNSVAAKYVSFADTEGDRRFKLAVHDRELELGDAALLQQVASVVPLASLGVGAKRSLDEAATFSRHRFTLPPS